MANYIFVAGTFHGGWYWEPITSELLKGGHTVFAPTLSGLEGDISNRAINLTTHIEEVVNIIKENALQDVILVGWSYGGMVITGVFDRAKTRIKKLIYLDAQLPRPGDREWDLIRSSDREEILAQCTDGLNIYPNEWLKKYETRTHTHPLGTKLQPLYYDQIAFNHISKVYVFAEKWFHDPSVTSPIKRSFELASQTPGWQLNSWPFGHDLVRECKDKVIELLLSHSH